MHIKCINLIRKCKSNSHKTCLNSCMSLYGRRKKLLLWFTIMLMENNTTIFTTSVSNEKKMEFLLCGICEEREYILKINIISNRFCHSALKMPKDLISINCITYKILALMPHCLFKKYSPTHIEIKRNSNKYKIQC